jgi:hypothetical protein
MNKTHKFYQNLVSNNATLLAKMTNELGQEVHFLEHPIHGDIFPIIVAFPTENAAFISAFYDLDDMMHLDHSEYRPFLVDGELRMGYELETISPQ